MAVHTVTLPDYSGPRRIVWDDEAGTVEGDHSEIPYLRRVFAASKPVTVGVGYVRRLRDPAHDPAEMLALIFGICQPHIHERPPLPPIFDGVALPKGEPDEELYDERGELLT